MSDVDVTEQMAEIYAQISILHEDSDGYNAIAKKARKKAPASNILPIIRCRLVWCECAGTDYNRTATMDEDDPAAHAMWCPVWIEAALQAAVSADDLPE
jgi:hypothetical protein